MSTSFAHLSEAWGERWPGAGPVAEELKYAFPDLWVRLYSFPGGKRYPESEGDYRELLSRHNTVIDELVRRAARAHDDHVVVVITCAYSRGSMPSRAGVDHPAFFSAEHFWTRIAGDDEGDEGHDALNRDLYAFERTWSTGCLDDLLRLVADDAIAGVIVADEGFGWLYHPYDGGADVIVASSQEREELAALHAPWLSARPDGL